MNGNGHSVRKNRGFVGLIDPLWFVISISSDLSHLRGTYIKNFTVGGAPEAMELIFVVYFAPEISKLWDTIRTGGTPAFAANCNSPTISA